MSLFETIILPLLHCICCTTPEPTVDPNLLLTQNIGIYFSCSNNDDFANKKIRDYFTDNKNLVNASCLLKKREDLRSKCTPLFLALQSNNYKLAVWFLDQGAQPSMEERQYFLQRAIQNDTSFDNKHIEQILLQSTPILDMKYIQDSTGIYTPLEYSQKKEIGNTVAQKAITMALKNGPSDIMEILARHGTSDNIEIFAKL